MTKAKKKRAVMTTFIPEEKTTFRKGERWRIHSLQKMAGV
jgi:hypothetical protein